MNKLKKVGISALTGTLVSLSAAQAGELTVGGTMELTYTNLDHDEVTGNPLGQKKNLTFSGSGEFANGWTYGITHVQNDTMSGMSSSSMNINMGGFGTIAYDSGTGGYGANAVDNIVPTAWEEVDYGFSTGITDVGAVSKTHGVVNYTIKAPVTGTALSLSYASRMGSGAVADGATGGATSSGPGSHGYDAYLDLFNVDTQWFGFRLGGAAEKQHVSKPCSALENKGQCHKGDPWAATGYVSLKVGPISAGFQPTYKSGEQDLSTAVANNQSWVAGVSVNILDYISFSYGTAEDRYQYNDAARGGLGETVFSHFDGFSAGINLGPVALKMVKNSVANQNGGDGGDQHREVNLSMSF